MAIKYGKKNHKKNNVFYTLVSVVLLCVILLALVSYFYTSAEEDAYENLHVQTKQIKDDIKLQIISDRENLQTMANFAATLYADGQNYDRMFDSFKSIGLINRIGILTPDNVFITKNGSVDLDGKISFDEEKKKETHITGRVKSLTQDSNVLRSAVPIKVNGITVGILYGIIDTQVIGNKYNKMAKQLDAQLFVYERKSGELIIDSLHFNLGNISFLKDREYNEDFTYEQMRQNDSGFTSFVSAYTGENLYMHYSDIPEFGWMITLARYESQVFAKTHEISRRLIITFSLMIIIMFLYTIIIMMSEKLRHSAMACASSVRKLLLEINQQYTNINSAVKQVCMFAHARSAIIFDTDGNDYSYIIPSNEKKLLTGEDREYFQQELLRYSSQLYLLNNATVNVFRLTANRHLIKTNPDFYTFLKNHGIREITFAAVIDKNNHTTILGVVNPAKSKAALVLLEEVAVCFSIAFYNKKHLNRTELAATTDSLTGALNRVAYKNDLLAIDAERPAKFSCIYIDVNELHFRNNKYGHAAGDEMLLYIANTLKEIFYGHKVYRMGGDEFLVFVKDTDSDDVKKCIDRLHKQLEVMDYHIAVGVSYRSQNVNTEELVREAEVRMYDAKAQYYQNKEKNAVKIDDGGYVQVNTGIQEIDAMISVLKEHYNGIYRVSLDTDKAHRILMPAYLNYSEDEEHFSVLFSKYIYDTVNPDFHRAALSFLNYSALKSQLIEGKTPKITYKKTNGETVVLSVYRLGDSFSSIDRTLWVFARAD